MSSESSTEQLRDYVIVSFVFTAIGCLIQCCNICYAVLHAARRPTPYNLTLVGCLVTFATSFIPLFFTAQLIAKPYVDQSNKALYLKIFTLLYGISTLSYMLMVQWRFRVIKVIVRYHDALDWIFVAITILLWLILILCFGVILPVSTQIQGLTAAAWTFWALVVDNTLSAIFISTIYKSRAKLGVVKGEVRRLWIIVVSALVSVCTVAWCALIMLFVSNLSSQSDQWKMLMFRIGFCFSTLQWSGALVFIYQAPALVDARGHQASSHHTADSSRPGTLNRKGSVRTNRSSLKSAEDGTVRKPSMAHSIKASHYLDDSDDDLYDRDAYEAAYKQLNINPAKAPEFVKAPVNQEQSSQILARSELSVKQTGFTLDGAAKSNADTALVHPSSNMKKLQRTLNTSLPLLSFVSMGSLPTVANLASGLRKSLNNLRGEQSSAWNQNQSVASPSLSRSNSDCPLSLSRADSVQMV